MPDIKDQIGGVVSGLVNAEPAVQINKGIAKVGEAASGAYDSTKSWIGKKLAAAKDAITPAPVTPPADIVLPKEKGRKLSKTPAGRSMSKGR